ncbi:hypothetical protein K491DRAFT_685443 [Lophiostoma macrostomum CBS 122681]|uniref:Uncharacterized protein n=1 Tax=Lophiostoma macrostomum CBS 122681 TaxID=1314788 RepID=A0A6A6SIE6_9PLEO|nr:hypothetical protein K491DRAFT_685443 [Lophiostoma macrostomum CBS 122681]
MSEQHAAKMNLPPTEHGNEKCRPKSSKTSTPVPQASTGETKQPPMTGKQQPKAKLPTSESPRHSSASDTMKPETGSSAHVSPSDWLHFPSPGASYQRYWQQTQEKKRIAEMEDEALTEVLRLLEEETRHWEWRGKREIYTSRPETLKFSLQLTSIHSARVYVLGPNKLLPSSSAVQPPESHTQNLTPVSQPRISLQSLTTRFEPPKSQPPNLKFISATTQLPTSYQTNSGLQHDMSSATPSNASPSSPSQDKQPTSSTSQDHHPQQTESAEEEPDAVKALLAQLQASLDRLAALGTRASETRLVLDVNDKLERRLDFMMSYGSEEDTEALMDGPWS